MEEHADTRTWLAANGAFTPRLRTCGRPRMIELVERLARLTDRYMYVHIEVIGQTSICSQTSAHPAAVENGDSAWRLRSLASTWPSAHDFILRYLMDGPDSAGPDTSR